MVCAQTDLLYKVAPLLSRMQQQGSRCLRLCMLQAYADLAPSYVTAAAAGARGIVRFGTRMSTQEFQARGRSSADTRGKIERGGFTCVKTSQVAASRSPSCPFQSFCTPSQISAACHLPPSVRSADTGSGLGSQQHRRDTTLVRALFHALAFCERFLA